MSTVPQTSSGSDPLEQRARAHLAAGRWRKARDELKALCKQDRAKFQPLLIEANVGLAREMAGKGLLSEAQQVLAYLQTIAGPEVIRMLRIELAGSGGATPDGLADMLGLLAMDGGKLSWADRVRYADRLVVSFTSYSGRTPEESEIAAQVAAIQAGLAAVSAGEFEKALEAVRGVGRESVFSHWKLFVKGLVAFHRGEVEKAERSFKELPAGTVPGRAADPYLLLLGKKGREEWKASEVTLATVARLTAEAGWDRLVTRAQALWAAGKHEKSYYVIRNGISSFPSEQLDLGGELTRLYFNSVFTMEQWAAEQWVDLCIRLAEPGRSKNPTEHQLSLRAACLKLDKELAPTTLKEKWTEYLAGCAKAHGYSARLISIGYAWLGETLMAVESAPWDDQSLRDGDGAIEMLKRSIELDPKNARAHLLLCWVYDHEGMKSERNRLLDVMTERFPDDKEVLLRAGRGCIERKAYAKGIAYFEQAQGLDRLDPRPVDELADAQMRLATQCFQKGQIEKGRSVLGKLNELVVREPDNFYRNVWGYLARWGVLEKWFGDAEKGEELLAAAREECPFDLAIVLWVRLIWKDLGLTREKTPLTPKELKQVPKTVTVPECKFLVRLWSFWRKTHDTEDYEYGVEASWLQQVLRAGSRNPFTREEASGLIELLRPRRELTASAPAFYMKILAKDKKDPLFRLYQQFQQLFERGEEGLSSLGPEWFKSVSEEAARRGDERAVQLARELEARAKARPAFGKDDWMDDEDVEDSIWEEDPEDEDAIEAVMGGLFDLLSEPAVRQFVSEVSQATEEEQLEVLRKKSPRSIPRELLEVIIEERRGELRRAGGSKGGSGRRRGAPGQRPADPEQLDLF